MKSCEGAFGLTTQTQHISKFGSDLGFTKDIITTTLAPNMVKELRFGSNWSLQELFPSLHFLGRKEKVSEFLFMHQTEKTNGQFLFSSGMQ